MVIRRFALAGAVVLACVAAQPVAAQEPGDMVRVRVRRAFTDAAQRRTWIGALERADADSVVLRDAGRRRGFARADLEQVALRTPVRSRTAGALRYGIPTGLLGAAMGAAVGYAAGAPQECALEPGGACFGGDRRGMATTGAGVGFVVAGAMGALAGSRWGRHGWVPIPAHVAALHMSPRRVAVAIALR